jgi:hypothetical protein
MGLFDQKEKTSRWLGEAMQSRAEPGEQVVSGFLATSRIPWWPFLILFPVLLYLELEQGIERPWWFTGVAVGGIILIFLRYHFVVLTDRRLLVLHLGWMSQRRVAREEAVPREQGAAELGNRMLNARLRVRAGSAKHDLVVARPYWPEAERLVKELAGSPSPS